MSINLLSVLSESTANNQFPPLLFRSGLLRISPLEGQVSRKTTLTLFEGILSIDENDPSTSCQLT